MRAQPVAGAQAAAPRPAEPAHWAAQAVAQLVREACLAVGERWAAPGARREGRLAAAGRRRAASDVSLARLPHR